MAPSHIFSHIFSYTLRTSLPLTPPHPMPQQTGNNLHWLSERLVSRHSGGPIKAPLYIKLLDKIVLYVWEPSIGPYGAAGF